ncbi:MAG: PIN domain-containing protein [Pseudomonadota bacterium]
MNVQLTILIDACVLCSTLKRHLLLALADAQLCSIHWSMRILEETERAIIIILNNNGRMDASERASQTVRLMQQAFPEAAVGAYERLEHGIGKLPDEGDRHVVAAAIKSGADILVTENLRDFPRKTLALYGIEPLSCDAFVADVFESAPRAAQRAIDRMLTRFARPDLDMPSLLATMRRIGLRQSAQLLEALKDEAGENGESCESAD